MSSTSGIRGRLLAGVLGVPELELYVVVTLQRRAIDEGLLLARVLERTPRGLLVEELSGSRQHALMGLPLALDVRVGDIVALSDAGIAWVAEDERDVIEQQRRRLAVAAAAKPETVPPRDDVTPITPAPTVGG